MKNNIKLLIQLWFLLISPMPGAIVAAESSLTHMNLTITVRGSADGPELVFVPGLTSHWSTFDEVCAALQPHYRCHLVQLPGFAGYEPLADFDAGFLRVVRDQLLSYVNSLTNPVVLVGHSLGGTVAID